MNGLTGRTVVASALCIASVLAGGCEQAIVEGGSFEGQDTTFGAGVTGSGSGGPGSLTADVVDDAEWEAYLERSSEALKERDTIITPWAKHLSADKSSQAVVTPDAVTLPNNVPDRSDYQVGDILISDNIEAGKVFLRRVTVVVPTGATTTYQTEPAAITDVVYQGKLTEQPTSSLRPSNVYQSGLLTRSQALNLSNLFPDLQITRQIDGSWEFQIGSYKFQISLDFLHHTDFDNSATNVEEFDASINWAGFGNLLPGSDRHEIRRSGLRVTTTCDEILEASQVIQETPGCQEFYNTWVSDGGASATNASATQLPQNISVLTRTFTRRNGASDSTLRRYACTSAQGDRVPLPFPAQTTWAQETCGRGVLSSFDFAARLAPTLTVNRANVDIKVAAEGSFGTETQHFHGLTPSEAEEMQDEGINLVERDGTFRYFVGWLPVVVTLKGALSHTPFKVEGEGNLKLSVERPLHAYLDFRAEVHFDGGDLESPGAWDSSASYTRGDVEIADKSQVTIEDISGSVSLTTEVIKIKADLLFYDAAGLYIDGPTLYNKIQVESGSARHWRSFLDGEVASGEEAQSCTLSIKQGATFKTGIKGQIPMTDKSVSWEFMSADSCRNGSTGRLCKQVCFGHVPLQVYTTWDSAVDIDLFVTDPSGNEASYSQESIPDAFHDNARGCSPGRPLSCEQATFDEAVVWHTTPEAGAYTYRLHNRSEESVLVSGFIRAQTYTSRVYHDEPIQVQVGPGQTFEGAFSIQPEQ